MPGGNTIAVDPANRLVAGELERRWNEVLQVVHRLQGEITELEAKKPAPLGEEERQHLMRLGADLELAWSHPAATAETRKRILPASASAGRAPQTTSQSARRIRRQPPLRNHQRLSALSNLNKTVCRQRRCRDKSP